MLYRRISNVYLKGKKKNRIKFIQYEYYDFIYNSEEVMDRINVFNCDKNILKYGIKYKDF